MDEPCAETGARHLSDDQLEEEGQGGNKAEHGRQGMATCTDRAT